MIKGIIGVELELEYNDDLLSIECCDYHSGEYVLYNDFFIAEEDSSLKAYNTFFSSSSSVAELISLPLKFECLPEALKSFKRETYKRIGRRRNIQYETACRKYKFADIFNFNDTMGCHVHISVYNNKNDGEYFSVYFKDFSRRINGKRLKLNKVLSFTAIKNLRDLLHDEIRRVFGEEYFRKWSAHYNRSYSTMLCVDLDCYNREVEINLLNNDTVEFRAFNLIGIDTWAQFFKMFKILLSVIDKTLLKQFRLKKGFAEQTSFECLTSYNNVFKKSEEKNVFLDVQSENEEKIVILNNDLTGGN